MLATGNFSLKITVIIFKNSSDEPPCKCVCLHVYGWGDKCGQQNESKQKKMDRQGKDHCCLSIHLRCTWKSSTMTAHPSATGALLSLLEQNQKTNSIHHASLLPLSPSLFFSSLLFLLVYVSPDSDKWPKLSSRVFVYTRKQKVATPGGSEKD